MRFSIKSHLLVALNPKTVTLTHQNKYDREDVEHQGNESPPERKPSMNLAANSPITSVLPGNADDMCSKIGDQKTALLTGSPHNKQPVPSYSGQSERVP